MPTWPMMATMPQGRIAPLLASLFACAACSSEPIAPPGDAGVEAGEDVVVQCGPALLGGADCASCAAQSCCAQTKACSRDAVCSAHLACVNACDPADHACLAGCTPADAGTDDLFDAVRSCELASCQPECAFADLACGALSSPLPDCDACLASQCCGEQSAVGTNADALHYAACTAGCLPSDASCRDTCALQHTSGWQAAHALEECTEQRCLGACPDPGVDCVGHVQLPTLTKSAIVYGVAVVDYATHAPVGGATVKVCERADTDCQSPLGEGQTDTNGQVGFYIPVTSPGFTGFADVSALGYYPTLVFKSTPIVDDGFVTAVTPLLSTAASVAQQAGTSLDPNRASFAAIANGCDGLTVPYVSASLDTADASTVMFYFGPNVKTTTGPLGLALALNAPVATATLTTTFPLTGQVVSSAPNLPARKGTLTEVHLWPN
jgi:hypothetical protein